MRRGGGAMSFRRRTVVLAAAAVAAAIVIASVVVYFVTRGELLGQVDRNLEAMVTPGGSQSVRISARPRSAVKPGARRMANPPPKESAAAIGRGVEP